jgi:hypothetical protein
MADKKVVGARSVNETAEKLGVGKSYVVAATKSVLNEYHG